MTFCVSDTAIAAIVSIRMSRCNNYSLRDFIFFLAAVNGVCAALQRTAGAVENWDARIVADPALPRLCRIAGYVPPSRQPRDERAM